MTDDECEQQQQLVAGNSTVAEEVVEKAEDNEKSKRRNKFTPPEELYDLSKPIPKVGNPQHFKNNKKYAIDHWHCLYETLFLFLNQNAIITGTCTKAGKKRSIASYYHYYSQYLKKKRLAPDYKK